MIDFEFSQLGHTENFKTGPRLWQCYIDIATGAAEPLFLELVSFGEQEVLGVRGGVLEIADPLIILANIGDRQLHLNTVLVVLVAGELDVLEFRVVYSEYLVSLLAGGFRLISSHLI